MPFLSHARGPCKPNRAGPRPGALQQLQFTSDAVRLIEDVNGDEDVRSLFSFASADRRPSYCLYEAPSPDAILAGARRASVPADSIAEVDRFASAS